MTLVARDVFPTLLEDAREILTWVKEFCVPQYSCDILVVAHGYAL
jgi:hypothetical protein